MAEMGPLVVCDSCVFTDLVTFDPRYLPATSKIHSDAKAGLIRLAISELTVAECCKLTSGKTGKDVVAIVEGYLANPFASRFPLTPPISARAAVLIRVFNLETCDAVIVATALMHKAKTFYTRDTDSICKRLRKSQKLPITLVGAPRPKPTCDDEEATFNELDAIEIIDLNPEPPTKAAPPEPNAAANGGSDGNPTTKNRVGAVPRRAPSHPVGEARPDRPQETGAPPTKAAPPTPPNLNAPGGS